MDIKAYNEIFNHIEMKSQRLHTVIMLIAVNLYANKTDEELIKLLSDISVLVMEYEKKAR